MTIDPIRPDPTAQAARERRAAGRLANSVAMVLIVFGDHLYSETFDRMAAMLTAYRTACGVRRRAPRKRYGPLTDGERRRELGIKRGSR